MELCISSPRSYRTRTKTFAKRLEISDVVNAIEAVPSSRCSSGSRIGVTAKYSRDINGSPIPAVIVLAEVHAEQ